MRTAAQLAGHPWFNEGPDTNGLLTGAEGVKTEVECAKKDQPVKKEELASQMATEDAEKDQLASQPKATKGAEKESQTATGPVYDRKKEVLLPDDEMGLRLSRTS